MRLANNEGRERRLRQAGWRESDNRCSNFFSPAQGMRSLRPDPYQACLNTLGMAACNGAGRAPIPDVVNDLMERDRLLTVALQGGFRGQFHRTRERESRSAEKPVQRKPPIAASSRRPRHLHRRCLERIARRRLSHMCRRPLDNRTLKGRLLPVCMAQGPKRCTVLAECSGQPPLLLVTR